MGVEALREHGLLRFFGGLIITAQVNFAMLELLHLELALHSLVFANELVDTLLDRHLARQELVARQSLLASLLLDDGGLARRLNKLLPILNPVTIFLLIVFHLLILAIFRLAGVLSVRFLLLSEMVGNSLPSLDALGLSEATAGLGGWLAEHPRVARLDHLDL